MNIAFLTPEYPHPKAGHAAGIGTSIRNLAEELVKQDIKVSIFVYGKDSEEVIYDGLITLHLIKKQRSKFFTWYKHRKYIQNYVQSFIEKDRIDIIEAPDWTGITAFMHFKIPVIIRLHGSDAYFCKLEGRKQKFKNYLFERLAIKSVSGIIAPTAFALEVSRKLLPIGHKPAEVIHFGLNLEKFRNPDPSIFAKGMILYIGTIIRKKGVLELPKIMMEVLKKTPDAHLVLIGNDAPDVASGNPSTWDLISKRSPPDVRTKIEYYGQVPYELVQDYMRQANVCVFPTFAETFGMVTIEAMALNKAVITSNFGWTNELMINGESGFLENPMDHEAFANNICQVLQAEEMQVKIGYNARKRVEDKFNSTIQVNKNITFYKSFLR